MHSLSSISDYLRLHGPSLSQKVLSQFPPLHKPQDETWPALACLRRRPFPAQSLAIMGIVKRWEEASCAAAVAECGTGKTLISLGSVFTHANGRPFTCLAMVPPQLVEKWARECFTTLPGVRVYIIDGVRNATASNGYSGINEVRPRNGRIVREGLKTTLSDLRLAKGHRSARARWQSQVEAPCVFVVSRERAKLGYFWRHAYGSGRSGPFQGNVVNPDTGHPVIVGEDQIRRSDFKKTKIAETVLPESANGRRPFFSPLWQADNEKIHRMAPMEFIGRYLRGFFDYGIADEVHEHARERGIVGHAQKVARAREDGEPVLLRRDVNTTDGDVAGIHFVSLQREIADFTRARRAMVGDEFREYGVGPRQGNGILRYLRLRRWGHYLVPPREHRALPRPDPGA